MTRLGLALLALLWLVVPHTPAGSQAARTIRIVISVPPGGTIDFLVRVLADQIGKTNGQTIVIESRPGAGGIIAAEAVARAAPDGSTLLINTNGMLINSDLAQGELRSAHQLRADLPSRQLAAGDRRQQRIALSHPRRSRRGGARQARRAVDRERRSQHHPAHRDRRLKRLAGVNLTYVPYTGGAPAINALLGGHVTAVLQNYSEVGEQVNAGKLRALATTDRASASSRCRTCRPSRSRATDCGRRCLVRPGGAGQDAEGAGGATDRLVPDRSQAPEVKAKLTRQALYPDGRCGADFAAHIRRQRDEYARVIGEMNIKVE